MAKFIWSQIKFGIENKTGTEKQNTRIETLVLEKVVLALKQVKLKNKTQSLKAVFFSVKESMISI